MKIIIDEKPVCCKENEENLKYSMLAVKKTVDGYLPQRFYKGFFAVWFCRRNRRSNAFYLGIYRYRHYRPTGPKCQRKKHHFCTLFLCQQKIIV